MVKTVLCSLFSVLCLLSSEGHGLRTVICYAASLDKVIVVVNGETITQAELDAAVAAVLDKLKKGYGEEELAEKLDSQRKEILNRMIEERLILSEAKKKGIKAEPAEIEEKLKEIKFKFESEEKFKEALTQENISLNELKQRYADQIKVEMLVQEEVKKKIVVSPAEILEYYNAHREEYKEPERVRLKNILIKVEGDIKNDEEAQKLAEGILGFLKAGENFDELALKYSKGPNANEGGELGFVKRGQMLKEIDDAVFKCETGQFTEVVKTGLGYHIFKVEEKKAEKIKGLDEVRNEIEKQLFFEKGKQRYKEWVEELKKNAYISFR